MPDMQLIHETSCCLLLYRAGTTLRGSSSSCGGLSGSMSTSPYLLSTLQETSLSGWVKTLLLHLSNRHESFLHMYPSPAAMTVATVQETSLSKWVKTLLLLWAIFTGQIYSCKCMVYLLDLFPCVLSTLTESALSKQAETLIALNSWHQSNS